MKIAIDVGHGMSNKTRNVFDSGAIHYEDGVLFEEAKIALRYALSLKDILRARTHQVFMTRDDEEDHAPYWERAGNAKSAGCEVFVSIHLNDFEDDNANGLEVLYRDNQDKKLAELMQKALIKVTGFKDRGIKKRTDLAVLKFQGPAILIELGFIAHDQNRNALLNPYMREAVCVAIADTLEHHLKN
jgi:N-acetylmuramoyl-L-alanine amidase